MTTAPCACPVAAVLTELAAVLSLQSTLRGRDGTIIDGEQHRWGALDSRRNALEAMAITSRASSLRGASLQIILAEVAADDMTTAMSVAGLSYEGRTADQLSLATCEPARSAYAVLAANGGDLPAEVVCAYWPDGGKLAAC